MRQRTILSMFIVLILLCSFIGCKDGFLPVVKTDEESETALSEVQSDLGYVSSEMLSSEEVSIVRSSIISSSKDSISAQKNQTSSNIVSSKVTSEEVSSSSFSDYSELEIANERAFMKVGGIGNVTIRTAGGTPYKWYCSVSPSTGINIDSYFSVLSRSPGGPVDQIFTFFAQTPGIYTVFLKKTLAWDTNLEPPVEEKTFTITITE